ncbi:MAG TPA: hypothetical protein VFJ16_25885 [Longimicrobium sp.]|nr:hypothetical protein [Longimicrobium sp.]
MRLSGASPSALLLATIIAALAGCGRDEPKRAASPPPAAPTAEQIAAASRALRPNPLADDRLHRHQGGPLCNRTDQRDLAPFRDEMPQFPKEDLSARPTFDCKPGPDGRALRLRAVGERNGWVDSVLVFARWTAPRPIQALRIEDGEQPALGADFLQGVDLNRDGWMDVKVGRYWGVTGNEIYDVFMYDPNAGSFVRDTVLSEQSHLLPVERRPCIRTHWVFGDAGMLYSDGEYCWIGGRWTETWSESQANLPTLRRDDRYLYEHTTRRRRRDGRYTTRVDTLSKPEAPRR